MTKVSPAQLAVLVEIESTPGGALNVEDIPTVTRWALLRKELIEKCERMYFGPRHERYRLTDKAKALLAPQTSSSFSKN